MAAPYRGCPRAVLLAVALSMAISPAPVAAAGAQAPLLILGESSLAALHGRLRAGGLPPGLEASGVAYRRAAQRLEEDADDVGRAWTVLDGLAYRAPDAAALLRFTDAGGADRFPWLRPALEDVASGLEAASTVPAELIFGTESDPTGHHREFWRTQVEPRWTSLLTDATASLALPLSAEPLRLTLVPVMPDPGGATFRGRSGPFSVVDCRYEGSAFAEVVLHEALHALDSRAGEAGLPAAVRRQLDAAGARAPLDRDLPHALLFLAAAEAVSSTLDPEHVPVGTLGGAYERGLGAYLPAARLALQRVRAGENLERVAGDLVSATAGPARQDAP